MPGNIINPFDDVKSDGLLSTYNSAGYRIAEIERHLHGNSKFYGLAGVPNGEIHRADRITLNPAPFVVDAGNDDWGAWVQFLGSGDTPLISGNNYFDVHQLAITAFETNSAIYFFQIAFGESADLAGKLASEDFTEGEFKSGTGLTLIPSKDIRDRRMPVGTKGWIRSLCKGTNTSTFDFYFGIHEYEG